MMNFMMTHTSFVTNNQKEGTNLLELAPKITSLAMVLTHTDIEKLKLVELKEELKKCTCSIKRVKAELHLRLKQTVENNMPLASNIDDAVMYDLEGGELALGEKWEPEGADDDDSIVAINQFQSKLFL